MRIINGRILVPVRFVAEALGAQVDWQAAARSLHASFEQLTLLRNWYEDVKFLVRPVGNVAEVVKDEAASRTTWVQGRHGWYVDEEATETFKTIEMAQMPDIFSLTPLSPPGYAWVLVNGF